MREAPHYAKEEQLLPDRLTLDLADLSLDGFEFDDSYQDVESLTAGHGELRMRTGCACNYCCCCVGCDPDPIFGNPGV